MTIADKIDIFLRREKIWGKRGGKKHGYLLVKGNKVLEKIDGKYISVILHRLKEIKVKSKSKLFKKIMKEYGDRNLVYWRGNSYKFNKNYIARNKSNVWFIKDDISILYLGKLKEIFKQ